MIDKTALWIGYIAMTVGGCALVAAVAALAFDAWWQLAGKIRNIGKLGYIMDAVEAYKAAGHYPPKDVDK